MCMLLDTYNGAVNHSLMCVMCIVVYVQVSADLTPETKSRVGVQFTLFKILGLLPIKAPDSAKGQLDTTFVDEELRISRGDKGKFVHSQLYVRSCIVLNLIDIHIRKHSHRSPCGVSEPAGCSDSWCAHAGNVFVLTMEDPSGKP